MNLKLKRLAMSYWWAPPLFALVVYAVASAFIPERPAFEAKVGTRINLGLRLFSSQGESLPITAVLQGKLSSADDQSTQHRFVLLSMWATWCAPCIKELPRISEAKSRLQAAGILPLLVNYDSGDRQKVFAEISAWLVAHSVNLSTVYDFNSQLTDSLEVAALPFSVLLDRNGNLLWMHMGELSNAHLAELIGEYKTR